MLARRYETRLDEDGLITFEKVWSKRIDIKKKQFRHPEHVYELCKALRLDTYSEEHAFLLMFLSFEAIACGLISGVYILVGGANGIHI